MSASGEFWNNVSKKAKSTNQNPVMVGEIVGLKPLKIEYQGVVISQMYGDTIFLNNLLLDENIELDVSSMDKTQNFSNSTAYQSPSFTAEITGTQKKFLTDLYQWIKASHNRYILTTGDLVAVQSLGNNTYIILNKVQEVALNE